MLSKLSFFVIFETTIMSISRFLSLNYTFLKFSTTWISTRKLVT